MRFRDFTIEIRGRKGDVFAIKVESEASGEQHGTLTLTRTVDDLLRAAQSEGRGVRGAEADRVVTAARRPPAVRPEVVGQALYDGLFSSPGVTRAFAECLENAKSAGAGVRLKVTFNPADPDVADLARLPWELLHDQSKYGYFGLDPKYPIVRYLEVPRPAFDAPSMRPPLRILVVSANPRKDLSLGRERENLEQALGHDPNIALSFLEDATIQRIASTMADAQGAGRAFHVLHYMGHGGFVDGMGVLLLHKEGGGEDHVSADAFKRAAKASDTLRLVFLNACNTAQSGGQAGGDPFAGVATALVFEGLPAVVAMQRKIPDAAAIALAKHFYASLARGESVEAALSAGRLQMRLDDPDSLDWAIPVLFTRTHGDLFPVRQTWTRVGRAGAVAAVALALGAGTWLWTRPAPSAAVSQADDERTVALRGRVLDGGAGQGTGLEGATIRVHDEPMFRLTSDTNGEFRGSLTTRLREITVEVTKPHFKTEVRSLDPASPFEVTLAPTGPVPPNASDPAATTGVLR